MPNIITHKRSSTSGVVPVASGLSQGELAINIADGRLYTKNNANSVINLGVTSISGTSITPSSGNFTENINIASQTASTIAGFDASKNITSLSTATYPSLTELSYLKGASSAVQTQLNNRMLLANGSSADINSITNGITRVYPTGNGPDGGVGHVTAFTSMQDTSNNYGWQIAGYSNAFYFRHKGTTFDPWYRMWTNYDFTSSNITNWNTAYGWGNHASAGYAPINSPALTGTPTAPTASSGTNTTQIATTAFVRTEISSLVDAAPGTLDTLNELAAALGDDPNFATTVTNSISTKIAGTGTINYVPKFTASQTLQNSLIYDDGTNVGIGTATPSTLLEISKDGGAVDLSLVRIANTNATGGTALKISRTGPQRVAQFIYQSGTTDQFYQGILRDGGLTTNGWSVSAGADLNVTAPAIHVTSGNYVGIGTKSPQVLLHVNGQAYLQSLNLTGGTADRILATDTNKNVAYLNTSTYPTLTELSYVKGTTSTIQTQINSKQAILTNPVTGTGTNGRLSKWSSTSTLSDSILSESSSVINIAGSFNSTLDDSYLSFDANAKRIGITKKGGFTGKFTYGSGSSFAIAQSNISTIEAANTFTDRLVIDPSGNVGIGTSTPTYKLQVNGNFGATTKSFRIDHPSKKDYSLEYGSLESPYHGVRLTGRDSVIKGVGEVQLPDYLKDLIRDDDTLNIQITNIKHSKIIYIDKIDLKNDRFIVKADRSKTLGNLEFFWTLTGVRKDVENLVVEKRN